MMLMFLLVSSAWAQQTITGTVTSADGGLPGATVQIKGTQQGTQTDIEGKYSITVPEGTGVLVFSYVGFTQKEETIGSRTVIDVLLEEGVLESVIITGYKTYVKELSNISAVTVDAEKIQSRPNASIIQSLAGQVPGLSINTGSGQPGGSAVVNLRGVGSINGSTAPLYIIDGMPVDGENFRSINPNEIANVTVLKDAGATAIYGNRGANGVIVINTKKGEYNTGLQVTYTGQFIMSQLQTPKYDLLSSPEQLRLENDYDAGRGAGLSDAEINAAETFDWVDYFFRNAPGHDHNIQLRVGGKNTTGYVSLGVREQQGILVGSGLERYNLRSNITGKSDNNKFNYSLNVSGNYSTNNEPNAIGGSGINRNYVIGAYQSVPYINSDDYVDGEALLSPLSFTNTPLFLIDKLKTFTRKEDEVKALASLNLGYEIIKGLTVNSRTSMDFTTETLTTAEGPRSFNALLFAQSGNNTAGFQDRQYRQEFTWNQLTSINYTKVFEEDHTVSVGLYNEMFSANLQTLGFRANGLDPKTFSPGDGSGYVRDNAANDFFVDVANSNILDQRLLSYFVSADYDYKSTYGFSATLRRDASSRFVRDFAWGTFWSVAGRANLHNMAFMDKSVVNSLKVRASYGTNGNQDITGDGYFAGLDFYRPLFTTGRGYGGAQSINLNQIPNSALRWETIAQSNVAVDFEIWKSRFRGTVEGYIKNTSDLYQNAPVSAVNGVVVLAGNNGKLQNRGVDLFLAYDILRTNDMKLTFNVIGNYNKQEILELPGGVDEIVLANGNIHRVGGSIQQYYTYRYTGINPENGNQLFLTKDGETTETPNPDTDRVALGKNSFPDAQGSFGFDFDWKGFFLTTNFVYYYGMDRYDNDYAGFIDPNAIGQFRHDRDILNAWTPTNTNTDIASLDATNLSFSGDRFLASNDFIRLRFLNIGYNVPQKILKSTRFPIRTAKIFANGENLITFTKWRGFDAEALNNNGTGRDDNNSNRYPTPRIYTIGIELGF